MNRRSVSPALWAAVAFILCAPAFFVGWGLVGAPSAHTGGCGDMCSLIRWGIALAGAAVLFLVGVVCALVGTVITLRGEKRQQPAPR